MMDHELEIERDVLVGGLRVRVCPCACASSCDERVLFVAEPGMRGLLGGPLELWIAAGVAKARAVPQALGALEEVAGTEDGPHKALLIHGALWDKVRWRGEALRQMQVTLGAPAGIDRLPDELILRTRAVVFGDDFTRTMRALEAVAEVGGERGGVQLATGSVAVKLVRGSAPMRLTLDEDGDDLS